MIVCTQTAVNKLLLPGSPISTFPVNVVSHGNQQADAKYSSSFVKLSHEATRHDTSPRPDLLEEWRNTRAPSVQIYISCVDCIVTLYRLRCPSGHLPDYTAYPTHKGQQTDM